MVLGQIFGELVFFRNGFVSTAELTYHMCIGYTLYNENS